MSEPADALYYQPELRVALTERELRAWVERLRAGGPSAKLVPDELERALEAALEAGLVFAQPPVRLG
jgi:hypothetical protein